MSYYMLDLVNKIKSSKDAIDSGDFSKAQRNLMIAYNQAMDIESVVLKTTEKLESALVWIEDIEQDYTSNDSDTHFVKQAKKAVTEAYKELRNAL